FLTCYTYRFGPRFSSCSPLWRGFAGCAGPSSRVSNQRFSQQVKPVATFAAVFALIYALLVIPWPAAKAVYGGYFRGLAQWVFGEDNAKCHQSIRANDKPGWPANFDTLIAISNGEPTSNRAIELATDSWQIGWTPTAFLAALIVATPV